jgi:putative ABC transport system permease protein
MSWLQRLTNTLLRRGRIDREAEDELAFHLDERTRENIARGLSPDEARREALLRFGGRSRLREETREADSLVWLDLSIRDTRFAFRGLANRPGLMVTAVLSLSLGIGATSAIFSAVDTVLLKPLPYPEPDRLVAIQETIRGQALGGNPARLLDWQKQVPGFIGIAGLYWEGVVLTGRGEPRRLTVRRGIGPVFQVFGINPLYGRGYREWNESEVVLSHQTWQTHFGGDRSILGAKLNLSQRPYTVVGIMPPTTGDGHSGELFAAANVAFNSPDRSGNWMDLVARLRPGETVESVNTQLATVAARLRVLYPATETALTARAEPLLAAATGSARRPLWLLFGTIAAVFLVVCANLASLLLVRTTERQREFAVRAAMGAGPATLLRLQLLEGLLLGGMGGVGGLLLAYWGVDLLQYTLPGDLPRVDSVRLDSRVALFAVGLSIGSGLMCGLLASLGISLHGAHHLRDGVRTTKRTWLRPAFVMLQVVLSTLLLAGAARLTDGLIRTLQTPLGFRPEGLIALTYSFPWDTSSVKLHTTYRRTLEQLTAIPGVRHAGFVDQFPLLGGTQSGSIEIPGRELPPLLRDLPVSRRATSEDYFATLGLRMQAGRMFQLRPSGEAECVVNAALVRRYFPDESPLGRKLTFDTRRKPGTPAREVLTIVGVVNDLRQELNEPAAAEAFVPYTRLYWPLAKFVVRGDGDPASLIAGVRRAMRSVDPNLPIEALRPLTDELRGASSDARALTGLLGGFAITALLVAAIGLYGLLAGEVVARKREIGIRLALGAEPAAVLAGVVRRGLILVSAGLALGLALTYPASQLIGPASLKAGLVVTGIMVLVAFLASALPARRASRVDPAIALRHE